MSSPHAAHHRVAYLDLLASPDDDSLVICSKTHLGFLVRLSNDRTKFLCSLRFSVLGNPKQTTEQLEACPRPYTPHCCECLQINNL